MAPSIRNMRRGVAAGGVALLVVVAVFLGIARLEGHHFHLDLPGRLGVDISQTANGFTYSQSQKGHTLFTIHASKLVQYKGDQAELHDVTITLYGPEGSGRSDKIYGSTFLYDRKQGIARATGPVRIDFASPETKPGQSGAGGQAEAGHPSGTNGTIHVVTSGVVFNQATGEASTDQHVEFVLSRATGSSTGAQYNEKSGVLVLDNQVVLTTTAGPGEKSGSGAATTVRAAHAQLFRDTHQAYLLQDQADSEGRHTASDEATINFRPDGSAERIEERGHVRMTSEDGAQVQASEAVIDLDAQSHPLVANLDGGVTYYSNDGVRTMQGSAVSGTLNFVAAPVQRLAKVGSSAPSPDTRQQLHHAQFRDAVTFLLQQHSLNGDPNGSVTRQLSGSTIDVDFAPNAGGKTEVQHVLGGGGAMVVLHDVSSKGPSQSTTISGNQLLATLVDGHELKVLDGKGGTKIAQSSTDGSSSISTGDQLHVTFAPTRASPAVAGSAGIGRAGGKTDQTAGVDTAVQIGNVEIVQVPAPRASSDAAAKDADAPSPLHATAQRAEYDAADQMLHLSGDPHMRNDTLDLVADGVDYHRDTGDASATGNVKATYDQQAGRKEPALGGEGPVHVTADHAQLTRYNNISIFYGAGSSLARMWQGGDAVSSPVLELDRDQQTLDAHGGRGDRGPVVHATLGAESAAPAAKPGDSKPGDGKQDAAPTRLTSATLHYAGNDHRADFRGSVTAEQPTGTVRADEVDIYLTSGGPAAAGAPANATGGLAKAAGAPAKASQLDHLVAIGHVLILQPGRRGTGEKLVYTAADGRYVLTGGPGQPPRIVDSQKGTTTGVALIFKSADDSVEVSNHLDSGSAAPHAGSDPQARTVTDTHTPN